MIRAAVLGQPVRHSLSPLLHSTAYQWLGVEASYEAIEHDLNSAVSFLAPILDTPLATPDESWSGFSLTMPLKELVFADQMQGRLTIDEKAKRFHTANTLVNTGSNFSARSTDMSAFARLLADYKAANVLVLGAGGTARAALGGLDGIADRITFAVRSLERAAGLAKMAENLKVHIASFDTLLSQSMPPFDLVISTLPKDAMSLSLEVLQVHETGALFEVLYNPAPTPALEYAQSRGVAAFDGIDLLVEQALDQIELFSGCTFSFDELRVILKDVARKAVDN